MIEADRVDAARVTIYGQSAIIYSGSKIVPLPNGSLLVIPPPLLAPNRHKHAPVSAIEYLACGMTRPHPLTE